MNPIDAITAYRPCDEQLDALWPPSDRAAALDRVLADAADAAEPLAARHRGGRRRVLVLGLPAVAAAVAVAVVVPIIAPSGGPGGAGPAAAAELNRLAQVAATTPGPTAGPGQFLHLLVEEHQRGRMGINPDGSARPVDTVVLESWTAHDGTTWRRDVNNPDPVDYYKFAPGGDDTAAPSPSYLNSLPTDPAKLEQLLRHNPDEPDSSGSDAAVFTAVGDMLRGGFAPPALRTALVKVLERLPDVALGPATTDALGRPAVQVTIAGQDSLFFDPATAQIIEEAEPSMGFVSVVKTAEVVDSVPAAVLRNAQLQR